MAAAVEETTVGIDHIAKNAQDAQDYPRRFDEVAAEGGAQFYVEILARAAQRKPRAPGEAAGNEAQEADDEI